MAVPSNYIDKITKGNDSRDICPAADKVRVNNENFEGSDLDGVLDEIAESISGAGGEAVHSVTFTTNEDGTFDVNVDNNTTTINLNHTHENMAKLIVCEESDLPSTLDPATIYAQVDDADTPTEIQSLWIAGLEFVGGGGVPDDEPRLTSPRSGVTIDFEGQSTVTLFVKGKNLASALSIVVTGDFTVTLNGSTVSSISASDANNGVTLTLTQGSGFSGGTISISSTEVDTRTLTVDDSESLSLLDGIKLTGTQWGQTDYNVNANTKVSMRLTFTENANTIAGGTSNQNYYFLTAYTLSSASKQFAFYAYKNSATNAQLMAIVPTTPPTNMTIPNESLLTENSLFEVGLQSMKFTPNGGTATTRSIGATATMDRGPLTIGLYHSSSGTDSIFNWYDLTIYELTITENNVVKRHYTPVAKNGVPGLLDSETGHFMSSKTSTEFVAIPLT